MSPRTPRSFKKEAAECIRLADLSTNPEAKEMLLHAAASWQALASMDEADPQPEEPKPVSH